MAAVAALAAGAVLGILGPLLSAVGGSTGQAAGLVLSAGWAWAAFAFGVGFARKTRVQSVVLALASLIVAVITYYLTKLGQGDFRTLDLSDPSGGTTQIDWFGLSSKALVWCVFALLLGPLLGLVGNLARSPGFRGLPFRVVVPLVAIVDTSQRLAYDAPLQGAVAATTWSVIRLVAAAAILALIGHAVITRGSRPSAK